MRLFSIAFAVLIAISPRPLKAGASEEQVKALLANKQSRILFATPAGDLSAALERRRKYTEIDNATASKILEVGQKIYKEASLLDVLTAAYAIFATQQQVEAETKLFESPTGILYKAALAEMAAPDFAGRVFKYWQTRDFKKIQQNRKNVIASYIKQTGAAEIQGVFHAGMDIAIDLSLNAFKHQRSRLTLETIKRQTRLRKNNYVMDNADELIQNITFAFRELKNSQIDMITRFYFSRIGEQSTKAYKHAVEITMDRAGETLMHNLNPDTKKPPTPPPSLAKPKAKSKPKAATNEVVKGQSQVKSGPPSSKHKLSPGPGKALPASGVLEP